MKIMYIGLGRIGLPQALVSADCGHSVFGFDKNMELTSLLKEARVPFFEPSMHELLSKHIGKNFKIIDEINIAPVDIDLAFFTLGTGVPVYPDTLDLTEIENLLREVVRAVSAKVYVFRTTLPVGTIDSLSVKYPDINLAFVPERLVEGNAIAEERDLPKIIGTYNDISFDILSNFFSSIGGDIVRVKNPRTAEFCKLTDNSYRNLTFSFSNDIAIAAENSKIDVYEVIKSVNHGYQRNNVMTPGPVSGYCLGKDPYIFEYAYPDLFNGNRSTFYHGRVNNDALYAYFVEKIKINNPKTILVLGLSFKADVDDFRMSHSINIINRIETEIPDCKIKAYDPFASNNAYTNQYDNSEKICIMKDLTKETFNNIDTILILTPHKEIKDMNRDDLLDILEMSKPLIFDAWNAWGDLYGKYEKYQSFGRGM